MPDTSQSWNLHHVGFVVPSIEDSVTDITNMLRATWAGRVFVDPLQRVRVTFLEVAAGQTMIELVEPVGSKSPVQRFLSAKGGGLHHLCYEVNDIGRELIHVRTCGGLMVARPKPAVAFGGRRIAWCLSASGLLVEFLEKYSVECVDSSAPPESGLGGEVVLQVVRS